MATSLGILTERIKFMLDGGFPSGKSRFSKPEIKEAICSMAATLLKADYFTVQTQFDGETIPEGTLLAIYPNIPLVRGRNSAVAALPCNPINLPERMGVFSVYPSGMPEAEFYPLPPGMYNLWKADKLLSDLDDGWYTWDNTNVTIWKDLVGAGYTAVDMKLAVTDFRRLGDNVPLPFPEDLEMQLITAVYQSFMGEDKTERKEGIRASPEV